MAGLVADGPGGHAMKKPASRPVAKPPVPAPSAPALGKLAGRLRLRDEFFRETVDPRHLLEPFNNMPGLHYFVNDAQSRLMAISRESVVRMGFASENEIIGRTVQEYLPGDLSGKYLLDDQRVIHEGLPLRNLVEMWFNAEGRRDWIITDKFPLWDARGRVVGLIGTIQSFAARRQLLAHLGPVGRAADYIRDHLGDSLMIGEIARQAGFSERQLQRLFHRVFGMTIQQFIIQSRIHAAVHELTHTDHPIADIAARFGFNDQSAFTNQFRAVTGLPPRRYREKHLAGLTGSPGPAGAPPN